MKTYSIDEFVEYCRTRGNDPFNIMNHRACAITQFMQSHDPEITSSYLSSNGLLAQGYNWREKEIVLADITGLTKAHVSALYNSYTFSEVVNSFEKLK